MDIAISVLVSEGFIRTRTKLPGSSGTLVVHSVAGSGKTTLIRRLLDLIPEAEAFTHGTPDTTSLTGRIIKPISERADCEASFIIIDEYLKDDKHEANLLFCDPWQYPARPRVAHFCKKLTHRFGKQTCKLLSQLGFEIEATREDVVLTSDVWAEDFTQNIIACEPEWIQHIRNHNLPVISSCDAVGLTFNSTQVVLSSLQKDKINAAEHLVYIALTRHRTRLVIATGDSEFANKLRQPYQPGRAQQANATQSAS